MGKPEQKVATAKELSSFYMPAKNLLINFPQKLFFSDFIVLKNNIKTIFASLDTTTNNSTKIYNKLCKIINKRKQELLELWAIDIIEGFQILQHARDCDEVVIINTKFATNHHAHAVDVIEQAVKYPEAQTAFFKTIAEQLKDPDKMLGMSDIQAKLVALTTVNSPIKPDIRAAKIKELFDSAVQIRRRLLLQEQDKVGLFAKINAAINEAELEDLKKLKERIEHQEDEFKYITLDVKTLDGDKPTQAKMFFDHIKQQAVAANFAKEEYFAGCEHNVEGVKQALLTAIDRQLKAKAKLTSPQSPHVPVVVKPATSRRSLLFGDPYHRLKKVAVKDGEKTREKLQAILPQIDLSVNITQDEFAALQKRLQKRIAKYDQTNAQSGTPTAAPSFPLELTLVHPLKSAPQERELSDEERAARHIYTGAATEQKTPAQFSMERNSAKMFDVFLQPNAQGISLTFANAQPSQEALVAGAEVIKDAVELVTMKKKKVKELVVSGFADDLFSGLAIYCSLACQNNPVRLDEEILFKQTPDNKGFYEAAELLKRLSQSEEGRKILIELIKNNNEKLKEVVEVAATVCMVSINGMPTRNQDIEASINLLASKSRITIPPSQRDIIPPSPSLGA